MVAENGRPVISMTSTARMTRRSLLGWMVCAATGSACPDTGKVQPGLSLVCRDAGFIANVQHVELMVGDPPAFLERDLGGADIHAAIELHLSLIHISEPTRLRRI